MCIFICSKTSSNFAYLDLVSLVDINLKNQTELVLSNYAKYTNPVSEATFLHAIALVIEESVLEETRKLSVWSLLIDETKMLEPLKLLHFGSDSNSKMIGVQNSVFTKLNKLNPFISNCYCIAYRLALARKDLAKDQNLQIIQAQNNKSSELAILQDISTRWLSLSNAVSNLYQIIFSVIDAFQKD
ncbi:30075_t:CDS:2, partial [Gigaspora margarita]